MIEGIVLAAGYASRSKTNKMALAYQGKAIILHTIETMKMVCDRVIVVTGHYHREISDLLENLEGIDIVYNSDYHQGMFSSVKKGVAMVRNDFFLIPGDYPKVQASTYRKMLDVQGDIIVPSYNHRLGHPIYFKQKYHDEILNTDKTNLKAFRNAHPFNILNVDDPGVLVDIDDLIDYQRMLKEEEEIDD